MEIAGSKCIHHWIITIENGQEVGRCKKCLQHKIFRNRESRGRQPLFLASFARQDHYRIHSAQDPDPSMKNTIRILEELANEQAQSELDVSMPQTFKLVK